MSQRGAVSLPIIIAVALGLGFGASTYLNYVQYDRAAQDKKLLQGQISDLKYQVQQDQLAQNGKPSPTPSPSPSDSPSPSPSPSASPSPSQTPAVLDASTTAKTATVRAPANLRSGPGASYPKLISLVSAGTSVTLIGVPTPNGYRQVTVNGKTGYILDSYLTKG